MIASIIQASVVDFPLPAVPVTRTRPLEKLEKSMIRCGIPIYQLAGNRDVNDFEQSGDDDFSFAIPGLSRFRVSAYKQRGALSVVIRIISFSLPNPTEIGDTMLLVSAGGRFSPFFLVIIPLIRMEHGRPATINTSDAPTY